MARAANDPEVRQTMANSFSEPSVMPPDEFRKFIASETENFAKMTREAGIEKR